MLCSARCAHFPYTWLFRSHHAVGGQCLAQLWIDELRHHRIARLELPLGFQARPASGGQTLDLAAPLRVGPRARKLPARSEEHTSELQSLRHIVCRLLLEKN